MKKLLTSLALITFILGCNSATALERFQAGSHYSNINAAETVKAPKGKIEVTEFFWYGCPHCFEFEPHIKKWLKDKPDNVVFRRIPAVFSATWEIHAKAYYAIEALGITEELHEAIFNEIHRNKRAIDKPDTISKFIAEKSGKDQKVILDAMSSFSVDKQVREAKKLSRQYQIRGVPAMSVGGKFTTSAREAGGNDGVIDVVNFLISKSK